MRVIVRSNSSWWKIFLDGIASEGGNIMVLLWLVIICGVFVILKFDGATEQLYFVLGALVGILKGRVTPTHYQDSNIPENKPQPKPLLQETDTV